MIYVFYFLCLISGLKSQSDWPSLQDAAVEVPIAKELVRPGVVPSSFKRRRDVDAGLPELVAYQWNGSMDLWICGLSEWTRAGSCNSSDC